MTVVSLAKKSLWLHRTFKFIKLLPGYRFSRLPSIKEIRAIWRVLPNTMLPLGRLLSTCDCVNMINKEGISGDIVECGVWSGGCSGLMALIDLKESKIPRKYVMLDSFEGLPQPTNSDTDVFRRFREQHPDMVVRAEDEDQKEIIPIGACVGATHPQVVNFLTKTLSIPAEKLKFHIGWFQDTARKAAEEANKIAILRLDGDWYESTKICIEAFYDKVTPGGFVIIDDYGAFTGCRKAIDEFRLRRDITSELIAVDDECYLFRV